MEKETNVTHGLKWGAMIGLVYCLFLFLRYNQGTGNLLYFGLWTFLGYVVVLILLLFCGITRKKKLGGFISLKNAFQTMFVAVLGFEFIYMAFNFLYLKFVDPNFFENFRISLETMLEKSNLDQEQINEQLEKFDSNTAKNLNLGSSITSFAFSIMISGIFALIFALIIKKNKGPFQSTSDSI
jgi:hypothetical protein